MVLDRYVHEKTSWCASLTASKAEKTKAEQTYAQSSLPDKKKHRFSVGSGGLKQREHAASDTEITTTASGLLLSKRNMAFQ